MTELNTQYSLISGAQEMGLMRKTLGIIVIVLTLQRIHSTTAIRVLQGDGQVWQLRMGLVLGSLQKGTVPSPVDSGCTNVPGNPGPKCPPTK